MSELCFRVQEPNQKPVDVTFRKHGKHLSATCNCGFHRKDDLCRHQVALLTGMTEQIISSNANEAKKIADWATESGAGRVLHDLLHAAVSLQNATDDWHDARKRLAKSIHR
jgi:uncharacterized Zn finger protein